MKNKKILIVTHQFLPFVSPRTTRWSYLIDELIGKGNEVTVLSGTNPENIKKNYDVIYFGNKKFSSNVRKIRQDSKDSTNDFFKKTIYSILKKIYRFLFKTFSWPDYAMFWAITIFRNRKQINNNYDIIISVSLPFTSHLSAYILKKRIHADWYMDIGDPFTLKINSPENNKFFYSFLNKFYERKFYKIASKIIFTHKEVAEIHKNKFNIDESKIVLGYPIASVNEQNLYIASNFNYKVTPIKIGYFGAFTKSVREPNNYINNIANFLNEDFEHKWYINEESKKYFASIKKPSLHKFIDIIPRDEAIKTMVNEIHILLSIGNLNKYQMPSKVIEYLSLGKPVLHYAEIENDPIYNFEKLFDNLKIINNKTSKSEIEIYIENIKENKFALDVKAFNNIFSTTKLINDLS
tara:strand:+ start:17666 stop:18889 length:1224 start_codon:yes stop_codon:yes gene_type:complete